MDETHAMRPGRASRSRRRAAIAAAAALALYAAGQLVVSLPAVERALRARVERTASALLGPVVTIGPDLDVDWAFRVSFGPVEVRAPGAAPDAPPVARVKRVKVRASALALLAGRLELASVRLLDVRVTPGPRARALRALLADGRARGAARAAGLADRAPGQDDEDRPGDGPRALPRLHVRDLVVLLELGGRALTVGPIDADLSGGLAPGAESAALELRLAGGGRAAVELSAREEGLRLRARAEGIGPGDLPAELGTLPARLEAGSASLAVEAEASRTLDRAEGRLRLAGEGLFLGGEGIAAAPVGPLRAELQGDLRWDGRERRLALAGGEVALAGGALRVGLAGELRLGASFPFSVSLRADAVDHAALVAALPPALAPPPEAPRPRGTFDARLDVSGPALAPAAWSLAASLDLSRMREASRGRRPQPLLEPFVHRPEPPAGAPAVRAPGILIGPRNPAFVPLAELPEHVVRAVTASEDAGFFAHHGFDFAELGLAFAAGAERGRVVRGGSTITQQLAKNLYLGREKTLARKVREAAITLALEACLPKARLLEIYLNLAEWGPGLHGIGPAARHWFGKDARALTPREAAFLASVIPNPVRYHAMRSRGLSATWEDRVNELLLRMAEQGALSDEDLLRALDEPLVFAGG